MEIKIKSFKTLDEQLNYLMTHKNVVFEQTEDAKKVLFDNNYYNLIACGKIKFTREINEQKHSYGASDFKDWKTYFEKDCQLNEHLMVNILSFERVINSRTAYLVSGLMANGNLSGAEQISLVHTIQGKYNYTGYKGINTWEHITKKTFGELRHIIKWLWRNEKLDTVKQIVEGYPFLKTHTLKMLDELVNLRNNSFHFRPINIYLVYGNIRGYHSQYKTRKRIVEAMCFQTPCEKAKSYMVEIFRNTKRFIDIKKQSISID